jgi:hypothetical protein
VDRLGVIERAAASEIAAFDERDRVPTLGGVVRHGQAVDAAPNTRTSKGADISRERSRGMASTFRRRRVAGKA